MSRSIPIKVNHLSPQPMISNARFKENIQQIKGQERFQFQSALIPAWFGEAAVLILFWDEAGTIRVVLTERSSKMRNHKGEVSFPGGRREEGESLGQTAIREAGEEIGIDPGKVTLIGRLDDAWSRAAFHLVPFVAWYDGIPDFSANTDEVAKILSPDIEELLDENNREEKTVERQGLKFKNTVIKYQESVVFGLTADLLVEALEQGMGMYTDRGSRRARSLQEALDNRFFAYQQSQGDLPAQSDPV
ncbi:MAG: CoA pyrophosphatase [bacterium]